MADMKKKILFDTDIGPDCDDAGALAMLCRAVQAGTIDLIGVTHCTSDDYGAVTVRAILDWYGVDAPIGQTARPDFWKSTNKYTRPVAEAWCAKNHTTTADFLRDHVRDAASLLRELLEANDDVTLLFVGPLNNFADLLSMDGGVELVRTRVREVIVMGGHFANPNQPEFNIECDVPAAQMMTECCPVPIVYCGFEAGEHIKVGRSLWTAPEENPVKQAYRAYLDGDRVRESWDLVTTQYALEPNDPLWFVSEECAVSFTDDAKTVVTAGKGARYVQYKDEAKLEAILDALIG